MGTETGEGNSAAVLWTIGHSSAEPGKLFELLRGQGIRALVDVRATPYSKYAPQWNREVVEAAATQAGLAYVFMGDSLGGKPKDSKLCAPDGKPDYARIAQSDAYLRGVDRLIERVRQQRVCILCSEEDPAKCHRANLVAATLVARGLSILHIRHTGQVESQGEMERRKSGGQLALF